MLLASVIGAVALLAACGSVDPGAAGSAPPSAAAPAATTAAPATTAANPVGSASIATSTAPRPAPAGITAVLAFTAPVLGGGSLDGASLAGKPVAFWFWAPT
jgi:hypothetical protein